MSVLNNLHVYPLFWHTLLSVIETHVYRDRAYLVDRYNILLQCNMYTLVRGGAEIFCPVTQGPTRGVTNGETEGVNLPNPSQMLLWSAKSYCRRSAILIVLRSMPNVRSSKGKNKSMTIFFFLLIYSIKKYFRENELCTNC